MKGLIDRYKAVDSSGKARVINVYAERLDVTTVHDRSAQYRHGMEEHRMETSGNHVNVNDDGSLEEVATGRKLQRVPRVM